MASTIIRFGDYTITTPALVVFLVGASLFSFGGMAAVILFRECKSEVPVSPLRKRFVQNFIMVYSVGLLLLVPAFLLALRRVSGSLGLEEFAVATRIAFGESDRGGIPRYFVSLTSVGTVLAYCAAWIYGGERRDKFVIWLAVLGPLLMNVLTFGRTPIYVLITGVIAIMLFRGVIGVRNVLLCVVLGLLLFVTMGILLGKGPEFGSTKSTLSAVVENLALYFVGGPVSFGYIMYHPASVGESGLSLRFFTQAISSLGGNISLPDIVTGYFSDVLGNVYTIYFAYWLDWGWLGVSVMSLVAGFFCTSIYIRARKRYPIAGVAMGMVVPAILNSATVDLLFFSSIPWLLIVVVVYLLWNVPIPVFFASRSMFQNVDSHGK